MGGSHLTVSVSRETLAVVAFETKTRPPLMQVKGDG